MSAPHIKAYLPRNHDKTKNNLPADNEFVLDGFFHFLYSFLVLSWTVPLVIFFLSFASMRFITIRQSKRGLFFQPSGGLS
jgi:hypothetical protein